jgi:hypothetical protein
VPSCEKWGVLLKTSRFLENAENISRNKLQKIRGLASRLLRSWHEDGVAGMDRVCGNLRQVGRQLGFEI